MKQPKLNEVTVPDTLMPGICITMSPGQWDELLQAAYDNNSTLLVVNDDGVITKAFQKKD